MRIIFLFKACSAKSRYIQLKSSWIALVCSGEFLKVVLGSFQCSWTLKVGIIYIAWSVLVFTTIQQTNAYYMNASKCLKHWQSRFACLCKNQTPDQIWACTEVTTTMHITQWHNEHLYNPCWVTWLSSSFMLNSN